MIHFDFATIVSAVIVFIAGAVQGLMGFGFGLVSVPLLVHLLPPKEVVAIIMVISTFLALIIAVEAWRWVQMKKLWMLWVGGCLGMPLGTWTLKALNGDDLKILIGVVIVIFGATFLAGFRRPTRRESPALGLIGIVSGFLNGATTLSGPPVILFFANQGWDKEVFRANIISFFFGLNVVTLGSYIAGGLITKPVLIHSAVFLPAMALGALVGIRFAHKVSQLIFTRIALTLVTAAGVTSLLSGLLR